MRKLEIEKDGNHSIFRKSMDLLISSILIIIPVDIKYTYAESISIYANWSGMRDSSAGRALNSYREQNNVNKPSIFCGKKLKFYVFVYLFLHLINGRQLRGFSYQSCHDIFLNLHDD